MNRYELTPTQGGLYGPKVPGNDCFNDFDKATAKCPTTEAFNKCVARSIVCAARPRMHSL
jgi:hypothetical protein